jgi:hypothetical protein
VVEEIIRRLPELTGSQLGRLEDELRRERQRRAASEGGGEGAPQIHEGTAPPLTEVLEYRPYEDGYLQLELRCYVRRDGSTRERGPYWYFQYHEGVSVRSSTSAKRATQRAPWPPSGQSLWGSRSLPWPGSARKDEERQLETFGT